VGAFDELNDKPLVLVVLRHVRHENHVGLIRLQLRKNGAKLDLIDRIGERPSDDNKPERSSEYADR
jgi:hypothetical protein